MQRFKKLPNANLNVDFILICHSISFSHGETRINSFKRETIKFT